MSNTPVASEATSSEPELFHGRSLEAALTVSNLDASVAWYHDVVGFAIERRYERDGRLVAVAVRAGEVHILLSRDDGRKGVDRVKGEGISLQITTHQRVDELADGIRQRGGSLAMEPADAPWGQRVFRLQDPDGFKFTISSGRTA